MHIYTCIHKHVYTCISKHIYIYMYTHVHAYIHTCVCICVWICIYIYMRTREGGGKEFGKKINSLLRRFRLPADTKTNSQRISSIVLLHSKYSSGPPLRNFE